MANSVNTTLSSSLKSLILVVLDALLERILVLVGQVRLTAIGPQFVNSSIVMAIHIAVVIAILVEFLHIVLHQVGGTVRIIGAVLEGLLRVRILAIQRQLSRIHPVAPGDAENAAGALLWTRANCSGIAAADCLADTIETQLGHGFVQHVACGSQT